VKLSVIGCGYLGAVHAACMTTLGHEVVGIDVDERKIAALREARAPFYEPGLPEILTEASATGRLTFSSDMADAQGADVHFICVGTPQAHGEFRSDLTYVDAATTALRAYVRPGDVVAGKSTVPVGTAERLAGLLAPPGAARGSRCHRTRAGALSAGSSIATPTPTPTPPKTSVPNAAGNALPLIFLRGMFPAVSLSRPPSRENFP